MRPLITLTLVLMLAAAAEAGNVTGPMTWKTFPGAAAPAPTLVATRQGGDTFASYLSIPSVPFSDTGTTAGYADDYEVGCGIAVDAAADVVYRIIPPMTGYYAFDLCDSAYDTKLAICDYNGDVIACNDDFHYDAEQGEACYLTSRLEDIYLDVHNPYFVVIDGYQGAAGDYVLAVTTSTPCNVVVPGGAIPENEPTLATGQQDEYNCGCQCVTTPTHLVIEGDTAGEAAVALRLGWRDFGVPDRDWLQFTAGQSGTVHVDLESDVEAEFWIYTPVDCLAEGSYALAQVVACGSTGTDFNVPAGEGFLVYVYTTLPMSPHGAAAAEVNGILRVSGLSSPQPVESTIWGDLKSMYR